MRAAFLLLCGLCGLVPSGGTGAATPARASGTLIVRNGQNLPPDLVCARVPTPGPGPDAQPRPTPTEIPDADEVEEALAQAAPQDLQRAAARGDSADRLPARPARLAIWGDSHMAAAFFAEELASVLDASASGLNNRFAHAGLGHAGVRGLVRKTCLGPDWTRELGHARTPGPVGPGPGLTSLVPKGPGATLTLDLRSSEGRPQVDRLELLYDAAGRGATLSIAVDDGPEETIALAPESGPATLELQAAAPMSLLRLRVVDGQPRLQGLRWARPESGGIEVFAYPGATVAGWSRADTDYLGAWFEGQRYDLVVLAYGTNEANDPRFNEAAYRDALVAALSRVRAAFPATPCLLIGPGDRGIRVPARPRRKPGKGSAQRTAPRPDLLRFARLHQRVNQIQHELAAQMGCSAWSMQAAMGGPGSAYRWARARQPLMAGDLIHFTAAGYRELARRLAVDAGWGRR